MALAGAQDIDMPTPIPFDAALPPTARTLDLARQSRTTLPMLRFLLAVAAIPPLLGS